MPLHFTSTSSSFSAFGNNFQLESVERCVACFAYSSGRRVKNSFWAVLSERSMKKSLILLPFFTHSSKNFFMSRRTMYCSQATSWRPDLASACQAFALSRDFEKCRNGEGLWLPIAKACKTWQRSSCASGQRDITSLVAPGIVTSFKSGRIARYRQARWRMARS